MSDAGGEERQVPSSQEISTDDACGIGGTGTHAGQDTCQPASEPQVPFFTKLILGIGESCQAIYIVCAGFYLNVYLLETACLNAKDVGYIQLIAGCWDAFNDPFIGNMSDRTKSWWGRRRPWLLFASIPLGIVFAAFWTVIDANETVKFVYYLICYMGISAGITSVQVQVGALAPELTDDYDERTSLATYRFGVGNGVSFLCLVIFSQIVAYFEEANDAKKGFQLGGIIFGTVIAINALLTFTYVREKFSNYQKTDNGYCPCTCARTEEEKKSAISMWRGLGIVFTNKAFLTVVVVYMCGPMGLVIAQGNFLLYCKYILEDRALFDTVIYVLFGTAFVFLPIWNHVAQKLGKKMCYYIAVSISTTSCLMLYWLDQFPGTNKPWALVFAAGIGSGITVLYTMPYSMLPDVIEEDELRSGERREGIYQGFFTIFLKLAATAGLALSNFILAGAGYEQPESTCGGSQSDNDDLPDSQPEAVEDVIRLLVSLIPAASLFLAIIGAFFYPITKEIHNMSLKVLESRKSMSEDLWKEEYRKYQEDVKEIRRRSMSGAALRESFRRRSISKENTDADPNANTVDESNVEINLGTLVSQSARPPLPFEDQEAELQRISGGDLAKPWASI